MVRFIHTADLQLILSPGAPDVRRAIQEARFETLTRIMEVAREREVDFVAICGDIFEDGLVSDETVHRAVRIFSDAAPMPVYIIPGNHDPLTPMSVYRHDAFRTAGENVAVLKTPDPVPVTDECALYPCPVLEKRSIYDPTAVIPPRAGTDGIRIGLAHGALMIPDKYQPDDHPIPLDAAAQRGLDYLALGHHHSRYVEGNRIAYPGTPEQTAFDDTDAGCVLLVTIDGPGVAPKLESIEVGTLRWLMWDRELTEPVAEALDALRAETDALDCRDRTLLRLRLTGTLHADSMAQIEQLEAWLNPLGFLRAEVRVDIGLIEKLAGKLKALAESDEVIAGAITDLQRLADLDGPVDEAAEVPPRSTEELMALWNDAQLRDNEETLKRHTEGLTAADAANAALLALAGCAREVEP